MMKKKTFVMWMTAVIGAVISIVLIFIGYTLLNLIVAQAVLDSIDYIILSIIFVALVFCYQDKVKKIMEICQNGKVEKFQIKKDTYMTLWILMVCVCFIFISILWKYLEVKLTAINESFIDTIVACMFAYIAGDTVMRKCFIHYEEPNS